MIFALSILRINKNIKKHMILYRINVHKNIHKINDQSKTNIHNNIKTISIGLCCP